MDEKFQDRIDDYLLNRMEDADKEAFLQEVEQDNEKREQLEFTKHVKDSIRSREEKLQALAQFRRHYTERATGTKNATCYHSVSTAKAAPVRSTKRIWLWISGVAALFVVGFFAVKPMFMHKSPTEYNSTPVEQMRGGDDIFSPVSADSTDNDTINIDQTVIPDE